MIWEELLNWAYGVLGFLAILAKAVVLVQKTSGRHELERRTKPACDTCDSKPKGCGKCFWGNGKRRNGDGI